MATLAVSAKRGTTMRGFVRSGWMARVIHQPPARAVQILLLMILLTVGTAVADSPPTNFAAGQPGLGLDDPNESVLLVAVPITNAGPVGVTNVQVRSIMLGSSSPLASTSLPMAIGDVAANQQFIVNTSFDLAAVGSAPLGLTVHGTFFFGQQRYGWVVHVVVNLLPKPAPGSAAGRSVSVSVNNFASGPYSPATVHNDEGVNQPGPPVPTGTLRGNMQPSGSSTVIMSAQLVSRNRNKLNEPFANAEGFQTNTGPEERANVSFRPQLAAVALRGGQHTSIQRFTTAAWAASAPEIRAGLISPASRLASMAQSTSNPVVFKTDTSLGQIGNIVTSTNCATQPCGADLSVAAKNNIVLLTQNWLAALSTDGGATFTAYDPTAE